MTSAMARAADVRTGIRAEYFTLAWMVVESSGAILAGIVAGSSLLIALGSDSLIEFASGALLLWRLLVEARGRDVERVERAEQRATWFVGVALSLLCVYVLASSIYGLVSHSKPENSPLGIGIAAAAVLAMPWLSLTKRRVADRIHSDALRGDAAASLTCAYMAATVLIGLALNALFHWWWAEYVAGFPFLIWLAGEARESLSEARSH